MTGPGRERRFRLRGTFLPAALALGLAWVPACGGDEEPEAAAAAPGRGRGRGPSGSGTRVAAPAAPAAPVGSTTTRRRSRSSDDEGGGAPPRLGAAPVAAAIAIEPEEPEEAPAPVRDLGSEVRDAVGSIESCLDLETARRLEGHLRVPVSATLLPSGRVGTVSVTAGSLSRDQNRCIEGVVERASVRGPIEDAPRRVDFTISMDVEITEPEDDEE